MFPCLSNLSRMTSFSISWFSGLYILVSKAIILIVSFTCRSWEKICSNMLMLRSLLLKLSFMVLVIPSSYPMSYAGKKNILFDYQLVLGVNKFLLLGKTQFLARVWLSLMCLQPHVINCLPNYWISFNKTIDYSL